MLEKEKVALGKMLESVGFLISIFTPQQEDPLNTRTQPNPPPPPSFSPRSRRWQTPATPATTVMSSPPLNVTMVAVDKGKSSGHAFRWTIKNIDNPVIIAVHVKHKNITHRRYPLALFTSLFSFLFHLQSFHLNLISMHACMQRATKFYLPTKTM